MTPEVRNELLAKAMVGRFRLGYIELSMLIAGTLFEVIINRKLTKYDRWTENRLDNPANTLEVKINRACEITRLLKNDSLFSPEVRRVFTYYRPKNDQDVFNVISEDNELRLANIKKRLHNFRWLRNQIMHGKLSSVKNCADNLIDDFILYVWREIAPGSFKCYFEQWECKGCDGRIIETIFKHTADYMVRGIDEVDIQSIDEAVASAKRDWKISLPDFSNLFEVRDKLVTLKKYLPQWLSKNAPHLHTNTLTTIDTTSAYIWMPLTRINNETQQGIIACTVSILATPLDFRIYMDFGGMAVDYRREYYYFLSSKQYDDIALSFVAKPNFYVFDTEWFCFITKKKTMCAWLTGSSNFRVNDIKAAREEIQEYKEIISNQITWNRMLHGYIFDRDYLAKHGCIDIDLVKQCLTEIISLNSAFEEFRSKKKEEKNI